MKVSLLFFILTIFSVSTASAETQKELTDLLITTLNKSSQSNNLDKVALLIDQGAEVDKSAFDIVFREHWSATQTEYTSFSPGGNPPPGAQPWNPEWFKNWEQSVMDRYIPMVKLLAGAKERKKARATIVENCLAEQTNINFNLGPMVDIIIDYESYRTKNTNGIALSLSDQNNMKIFRDQWVSWAKANGLINSSL